MRTRQTALAVALALVASVPLAGQEPAITLDGDDITLRGCVTKVSQQFPPRPSMLVWSRGDILLAGAVAASPSAPSPVGTSGLASRVIYWIEDDDDLAKHDGQEIEIKGELEDFERGEIEIDRDGEFTEITLDLDDDDQKIRVPNSWLSPAAPGQDRKFEIAARRMKVKDLHVLGACGR
jgi:hypothetical protein